MASNSTVNGRYLKVAYTTAAALNCSQMVWAFLPSAPASTRGLIGQAYNSIYGPRAYLDSSNVMTFDIDTPTSPVLTGPVAPVKQWFHVAIVVSSADASTHLTYCYVNGQCVATQLNTETFGSTNNLGFTIPNDTFATSGYLRDARIWNRPLTGTEVAQEFASRAPRHTAGLICWAPLDVDLVRNQAATGARLVATGGAAAYVGIAHGQGNRRAPRRAFV